MECLEGNPLLSKNLLKIRRIMGKIRGCLDSRSGKTAVGEKGSIGGQMLAMKIPLGRRGWARSLVFFGNLDTRFCRKNISAAHKPCICRIHFYLALPRLFFIQVVTHWFYFLQFGFKALMLPSLRLQMMPLLCVSADATCNCLCF